jgi:hypothetical protein
MSSEVAKSSPLLTHAHLVLLKSALAEGITPDSVSTSQRQAIRDICNSAGDRPQRPEQLLIAFKALLNEAATDANLPLGSERSVLFDRLVTVFIEELYRAEPAPWTIAPGESNGKAAMAFTPAKTPGLPDAHP